MAPNDLNVKVISLQRNVGALFELLGKTDDEREKFLEIWKGITSRAIGKIVDVELETIGKQIESANVLMKTIVTNAKELSETRSQAA